MFEIIKGNEPTSLTAYRMQPDADYDGPHFTPVKNDIREQMLREQGATCAYCMQRISLKNMKVEHWEPQKHANSSVTSRLSYQNLLGCCKGNEGEGPNDQTCDTKKANSFLKYSPARAEHRISSRCDYSGDGRVGSKDIEFDLQLNQVLNLNYTKLVARRRAAIDSVREKLNLKKGTRTKDEIRKLIDSVSLVNDKCAYQPFYGVMIKYLKSKL
jgi:uncharacterized protein (TIGR02646 family)